MHAKAAITVLGAREEVERRWRSSAHEHLDNGTAVTFKDAPGDRGTEIHVDLEREVPGGKLGDVLARLTSAVPLAHVKDELRRFKQLTEAGEVPRSDSTPTGEAFERKFKQRPAQPLSESELEELVGV
jgi:uncharacterized membrane protein